MKPITEICRQELLQDFSKAIKQLDDKDMDTSASTKKLIKKLNWKLQKVELAFYVSQGFLDGTIDFNRFLQCILIEEDGGEKVVIRCVSKELLRKLGANNVG